MHCDEVLWTLEAKAAHDYRPQAGQIIAPQPISGASAPVLAAAAASVATKRPQRLAATAEVLAFRALGVEARKAT